MGSTGRFKFTMDLFYTENFDKACWLHPETFCINSFSLEVKLVPLSDHKTDEAAQRADKRSIQVSQLPVSIDGTISKQMALVVRQVKGRPHRLSVDLLTKTW